MTRDLRDALAPLATGEPTPLATLEARARTLRTRRRTAVGACVVVAVLGVGGLTWGLVSGNTSDRTDWADPTESTAPTTTSRAVTTAPPATSAPDATAPELADTAPEGPVTTAAEVPTPTTSAAAPTSSFTLDAAANDPFVRGAPRSGQAGWLSKEPGRIQVAFDVTPRGTGAIDGLLLVAPSGSSFAIGRFAVGSSAGLEELPLVSSAALTLNGVACGDPTGTVDITEIIHSTDGRIASLRLAFDLMCTQSGEYPVRGTVSMAG